MEPMFTWRVRAVAEARGIVSVGQLAEIAGISSNTALALWRGGQERIDFPTLGRICLALDCTPSDVIVFNASGEMPRKNWSPQSPQMTAA